MNDSKRTRYWQAGEERALPGSRRFFNFNPKGVLSIQEMRRRHAPGLGQADGSVTVCDIPAVQHRLAEIDLGC